MSFFFSSRRRHTRCSRDWSSDVCSSDLKVGMGIRINQMNVRAEGFQDGFWVIGGAWTSDKFAFAGSSMADLLLGMSSLRIHDQNLNGDITGRRWKLFRPFVQDDWRVNKNLTVNLG